MVEIWGIKTCDTVRKARHWLDVGLVEHVFRDFREEGLTAERLAGWIDRVGWQTLLNRASTTFRALPEAERADLDAASASALMLTHVTAIKRPVVVLPDGGVLVGFDPAIYGARLLQAPRGFRGRGVPA